MGLVPPFHEAHFRLLSELRSVIKKSRNKRGKFKTSPEMVRFIIPLELILLLMIDRSGFRRLPPPSLRKS